MPSIFAYTARTASGALAQGELAANDRNEALNSLVKQGLSPILVKETKSGSGKKLSLSTIRIPVLGKLLGGRRVSPAEKIFFSRQLATMADSHVPIARALAILEKQATSPRMKVAVAGLTKKVEAGATISEALTDYPDVFSPVYINMVKAGEAGGILDEVLDRLATQQEKDAEIVSKVRGASIYPMVISVAALGAFVFLMTVIVPKLSVIFEQFGSNLPIYTRIMLGVSKVVTKYWVIVLGVLGVGIVLLNRWHKTKAGKKFFDKIAIGAPILGPIIIKLNAARFARTFGSLMSSGLAIVESLNITAAALGNSLFRDELLSAAEQVKNGKSVSDILDKSRVFPPIVAQMTRVGEETGQIDKVLLKLATYYEREVDDVVSNLTSVIEPVLILFLGLMVGSIVLSVFGPISQLSQTVSQ